MRRSQFALALLLCHSLAVADDSLSSLDEVRFKPTAAKGSISLVPGHQGQANEFKFDKDCQNLFFTSTIRGTADWDQAAGFSLTSPGAASGSVNRKIDPPSGFSSTLSRPWWNSTIERQMLRPIPMPSDFVL